MRTLQRDVCRLMLEQREGLYVPVRSLLAAASSSRADRAQDRIAKTWFATYERESKLDRPFPRDSSGVHLWPCHEVR